MYERKLSARMKKFREFQKSPSMPDHQALEGMASNAVTVKSYKALLVPVFIGQRLLDYQLSW